MTKKSSSAKSRTATKPVSDDNIDQGAPIEHFRGERARDRKTGDSGDIEEETLDRDAPFNKTYGTRDEH